MPVPFAINGLGRIGRALLRIARGRPGLRLVAVNDQADAPTLARLLAHDTVHGRFPGEVAAAGTALALDGARVPLHRESEPGRIPWAASGARVVVEATGRFRSRPLAAAHLGGSVERVVISATAADADVTLCRGINEHAFDPGRHRVVSHASCTTNCVAAVAQVLLRHFGVERLLMNTVHCYTNSQNLVDMAHPDPRRARAAGVNIIPTTSDAVGSVELVLPELAGRFEGLALRVPVATGALVDLVALLGRSAGREELAAAFRDAAGGELAGILAVTEEELVSSDFVDDPHSAIVDLPLLQELGGNLHRVIAWYDNEWGYATRLAELVEFLGQPS
jgi:glyceraldehyde 3-phosphate dehydrogenase